ncbi:MAG: serine/threonine-protein kinase [Myxococcota bacterium]
MTSLYSPGRIIGGRYRVVSALSQGGMGAVYLAQQISLGRDVAVKVILERDYDPELTKRFDVEARAVCLLKHPNIITYHDYGRDEEGHPYLVMEFLPGYPGTKLVYGERRSSLKDLVHVIAQMCSALHEAHSKGIVHRDLKWSNVMIVPQSHDPYFAKLIDFGIIKVAHNDGSTNAGKEKALTVTGVLIGTPEYMSPEAICGMPIDGRADQYSLGVMLWEALEGVRPFQATTQFELLRQQVQEEPPPFENARPIMNQYPSLEAVVLKAMEKHPDDRFATIIEMRDHLLAAVGLASARSAPLPALAPAARRDPSASTRPRTAQPVPKSQRALPSPGIEVPAVDTGHRTGREARRDLTPAKSRTGLFVGVAIAAIAGAAGVTAEVMSGSRTADAGVDAASDAAVAAAPPDGSGAPEVALAATEAPGAPDAAAPDATALAAATKPVEPTRAPVEDVVASAPDVAPAPVADSAVAPADTSAPPLEDVAPERPDVVAVAAADVIATSRRPDAAVAPTATGEVLIQARPPAEIFVGGASLGWTPKSITLKAGRQTIALHYRGTAPDAREFHTVKVVANQQVKLVVP